MVESGQNHLLMGMNQTLVKQELAVDATADTLRHVRKG